MPLGFSRRYRHLKRYRQIGEVLLRHGFGYLIQLSGIKAFMPPLRRLKAVKEEEHHALSLGARIRLVLEQLGPTFIKFGQLMSTRPDLVPPDILKELEGLQDNVAPVNYKQIKEQVERSLGSPIDEMFSSFSTQPLAAASIGQVHRAALLDGTDVVVKVRRPGVEAVIATDLEIICRLANAIADRIDERFIDIVELVDYFAKMIGRELDYTREGRNIDRFHKKFKENPDIVVPKVYWDYTTEQVLTMNYIDGIKLRDLSSLKKKEIDTARIADVAVKAFVQQVFEFGMFHGDPHPGNLLVTEAGALVFLDFGIIGRIDPQSMELLAKLMFAITKRDVEAILNVLTALGALTEPPTRELYLDLSELIDDYYDRTLKELNFSYIAEDLLRFTRTHPIRMPVDLTLLIKALVTLEGIGSRLAPDFNVIEAMEPFAKAWAKRNYSAKRIAKKGFDTTKEWVKAAAKLPIELESALNTINRGDLEIKFKHKGLERLINRLDIISNRLTAGLIVGSLIIGSSFVLTTDRGPRILNLPLIGLLGFLLAGMIGIWLLISILRSGRY